MLPNGANAVIDPLKLTGYLLSLSHPDGAAKAKFFNSFGFTLQNWHVLRDALLAHALDHPVAATRTTVFGQMFEINGNLRAPDGRNPVVLVVWEIPNGKDRPRLVTAVPSR